VCRVPLWGGFVCEKRGVLGSYGSLWWLPGDWCVKLLLLVLVLKLVGDRPGFQSTRALQSVGLHACMALVGLAGCGRFPVMTGVVQVAAELYLAMCVMVLLQVVRGDVQRSGAFLNLFFVCWVLGGNGLVSVVLSVLLLMVEKYEVEVGEVADVVEEYVPVVVFGGLQVWRRVAAVVAELDVVSSTDVGWPRVRVLALEGDRVLKVLLARYVARRGGSVSEVSALEQVLDTDAAFVSFAKCYRAEWWASLPVHMRGKAVATVVEASWGLLFEHVLMDCKCVKDGSMSNSYGFGRLEEAHALFLHMVASASGLALEGVTCVAKPVDKVESVACERVVVEVECVD